MAEKNGVLKGLRHAKLTTYSHQSEMNIFLNRIPSGMHLSVVSQHLRYNPLKITLLESVT